MEKRKISEKMIEEFRQQLVLQEKSNATVQKYIRDVRCFARYAGGGEITKKLVVAYKQNLVDRGYAVRSINSMIASLNCLFQFTGWHDCRARIEKVQQQIFRAENKELTEAEYLRLCNAARSKNPRLLLILQTLCSTGIRISELRYITVEATKCSAAAITCKSKTRQVFIVKNLQKKLLRYAAEQGIKAGSIFVTRTGKPVNRTNIWREMKELSKVAGVNEQKVFPHNLRHLFARMYYALDRNIVELADVLGHSSINTTRIYITSTGKEHRRKMEKIALLI